MHAAAVMAAAVVDTAVLVLAAELWVLRLFAQCTDQVNV